MCIIGFNGENRPLPLKMPATHVDVADTFKAFHNALGQSLVAYLEEVSGRAGGTQTAQQGFSLGRNLGNIETALYALGIPCQKVRPQIWQKSFSLGDKKAHGDKWKHHCAQMLGELYPSLKCPLYAADSVFLALYGYKREFNTEALPR